MEVEGKIKVIGETQSFGDNGFRKRELVVVTDNEQYPQPIMVEFVQDKVELLDKFKIGQTVKVQINLRGREWEDKKNNTIRYFNSIQGWAVVAVSGGGVATPSIPQPPSEGKDDLPF
jgi:hypothetical protein